MCLHTNKIDITIIMGWLLTSWDANECNVICKRCYVKGERIMFILGFCFVWNLFVDIARKDCARIARINDDFVRIEMRLKLISWILCTRSLEWTVFSYKSLNLLALYIYNRYFIEYRASPHSFNDWNTLSRFDIDEFLIECTQHLHLNCKSTMNCADQSHFNNKIK